MEKTIEHDGSEPDDQSGVQRRPVLTVRRPGIERLLGELPIKVDAAHRDSLRDWALALTADASRWQVEQARQNAALVRNARSR